MTAPLTPEVVTVDQYEHRGLTELVAMCDARGIDLGLAERTDAEAVRDRLRAGVTEIVKEKARRKHKKVKLTDEERRRQLIEQQILEACADGPVGPREVARSILRNATEGAGDHDGLAAPGPVGVRGRLRDVRGGGVVSIRQAFRDLRAGWGDRDKAWRIVNRATTFTGNCPVREHTGDGAFVGRCEHACYDGICPRHGRLSDYPTNDDREVAVGHRRFIAPREGGSDV